MLKYIAFSVISFILGLFTREIIEILERKKKYEKIKKLNEQDFKKATKNLEIK